MRRFEHCLREQDFTLTAELPLTPASTTRSVAADLSVLRAAFDAVQVTDNPRGIPHMAPLVAARLCLDAGVDPVVHLSGRDRNRIALQSELLGAAAQGVSSLLLQRGEPLPPDLSPRAAKVFELGAKRLLRAAALIGGEAALVPEGGFFLGARVKVMRTAADWRPAALTTKADLGCKFVQTQPLLDTDVLRTYMERLVATRLLQRVSVIVSVPLLADDDPGLARLPESLRTPAAAGADRGARVAAAVLRELATVPGVSGANLVGIEDAATAVRTISLSEIRA